MINLKELLSKITGFDVAEIESDMELDFDLSFDSIKRIRLVNNLTTELTEAEKTYLSQHYSIEDILRLNKVSEFEELLSFLNHSQEQDTKSDQLIENKDEPNERENELRSTDLYALPITHSQYLFLLAYWSVGTLSLVSRCTIKGDYDADVFKLSWKTLLDKHPALASYFECSADAKGPRDYELHINQNPLLKNPVVTDLRELNKIEKEANLSEFSNQLLNARFDIFEFPLHKFYIFILDDQHFEILFANNHLISDGVSNQIIMQDFVEIYDVLLSGKELDIDKELILSSYLQKIEQTLELIEGQSIVDEEKERFVIPSHSKNLDDLSENDNSVYYLSTADTAALYKVAADHNLSLYNLLVSAYLLALSEISPEHTKIMLNLPTSGRIAPSYNVEGLVGCFAQNLSLSFDVTQKEDLLKLAEHVQSKINASFVNYDDLRQGVSTMDSLLDQDILENRALKKEFSSFMRNSLASVAYLSFVGKLKFQESYDNFELVGYRALTGTNRNSVDILVEEYRKQLMLSLNYDKKAFNKEDIQNLFDQIKKHLMRFRVALGVPAETVVPEKDTFSVNSRLNDEVLNAIKNIANLTDIDSNALLSEAYSITSIEKMRILTEIAATYHVEDKIKLFEARTLNEIVNCISPNSTLSVESSDSSILSPAQNWIFSYFDSPYQWAGYSRFILKSSLDTEALEKSFLTLVKKNDALRMRFIETEFGYEGKFEEEALVDIKFFEVNDVNQDEYEDQIGLLIQDEVSHLEIEDLPLFKVRVFVLEENKYEFVLIGHHLILDMISDHVLFDSLWQEYNNALIGKQEILSLGNSFQNYINAVNDTYMKNKTEIALYWENEFENFSKTTMASYDENGSNTQNDEKKLSWTFDSLLTSNLQRIASKKGNDLTLYHLISTPLYQAMSDVSNETKIAVSHRMHGRRVNNHFYMNDIGNFAINFPVILDTTEKSGMKLAKELSSKLLQVPIQGLSYDLECPTSFYPDNEVTIARINFLGDLSQKTDHELFESNLSTSNQRFTLPEDKRISEIEWIFHLHNGHLHVEVQYSSQRISDEQIQQLFQKYFSYLSEMVYEYRVENVLLQVTDFVQDTVFSQKWEKKSA